jgi:hypothetical protein
MGLGKTLQTLALCLAMIRQKIIKKICYCLPTNFVRCLVKIDKKMVAIKNNSTGLLW